MSKTSRAGRKAKNIFRKELEKRFKEAINDHLDQEHRTLREIFHDNSEWEAYKLEQEWEEARRIMDDDMTEDLGSYYEDLNYNDYGFDFYDDLEYDDNLGSIDDDYNEYDYLEYDNHYDPDPFYDSPNFYNSILNSTPGHYYTDGANNYLCIFIDQRIRYVNVHTGLEYTGFTHSLKEINATS